MLLYLILLLLLMGEAIVIFSIRGMKEQTKNKLFLILSFIQLFLISGLRGADVGNDTSKYLNLFQTINSGINFDQRYEKGYIFFNKLVYTYLHNSQWIIIISSFVTIFLFMRFFYKHSNNVWLSVYLFITLMFYYFTMSGIRQALAMGLVVTSYDFLLERKLVRFIICVYLASLFHAMAIIFLFVYPLSYIRLNVRTATIILTCGIVAFFEFGPLLHYVLDIFPKYQYYLKSQYFVSNRMANVINAAIPCLVLLLGHLLVRRNKSDSDGILSNQREISSLNFLIMLGMIFAFISINASVIDRVYYYFAIFTVVYIPKVLAVMRNKKLRFLVQYGVMSLALIYNFTIFIFRPEWNAVFPYNFFWN